MVVHFVNGGITQPGVGTNGILKTLHGDPTLGHVIVVVNAAARDESSPSVLELLVQLGLGFDAALAPAGPTDGDALVFRVPHERLAEVVVGLESYGFAYVRAYEGRDADPIR
jgi:hypothetical protein